MKDSSAVTLTEFGDYQCPFCKEVAPVIKKLQKEFGDKLNYEFKNFPLIELHPMALMAAEAAEAARSQGKFDEMHDALFRNQSRLSEHTIISTAKKLNLDMTTFASDITHHKFLEAIKSDLRDAMKKNVQGTPTFFINNRPFEKEWTYTNLSKAIKNDPTAWDQQDILY